MVGVSAAQITYRSFAGAAGAHASGQSAAGAILAIGIKLDCYRLADFIRITRPAVSGDTVCAVESANWISVGYASSVYASLAARAF